MPSPTGLQKRKSDCRLLQDEVHAGCTKTPAYKVRILGRLREGFSGPPVWRNAIFWRTVKSSLQPQRLTGCFSFPGPWKPGAAVFSSPFFRPSLPGGFNRRPPGCGQTTTGDLSTTGDIHPGRRQDWWSWCGKWRLTGKTHKPQPRKSLKIAQPSFYIRLVRCGVPACWVLGACLARGGASVA